ncbi:uncharacterized protein BDZ99DRAFT_139101 [Mytilinidion resinicola]|uniref:Uncharacterized protein n=1 Tax=Mytilinidion resinicola TaxID=574789 RepID=A0A6A6Z8N3_9PEZI|nr:uncharacterized protein BDZ99DRAFT_139101 [Mytilinidion resinicola]KAF2816567.1 hypothetical protein BDZ99DRAFT_139101 [Mytilinidion resinicola]
MGTPVTTTIIGNHKDRPVVVVIISSNVVVIPGSTTLTAGPPTTISNNGLNFLFGPDNVLWVDGTSLNVASAIVGPSSSPSSAASSNTMSTILTTPTPGQSISFVSSTAASGSALSATQSTTSPTATGKSHPSKSGVSGGAAAGIAIGCLIAGAAIAGLIVWLLMRRSRNKIQAGFQDRPAAAHAGPEKQLILGAPSNASSDSTLRIVENHLPLPLEDNAISGDVTKLSTLIKNHVQSYYHESPVASGTVDLDALQALGDNLPVSIGTLGTLLSNPTTREVGLRFCIAWVIISRSKLNGDPKTTLLPPEVVQCVSSMSAINWEPKAWDAFTANWKAITAECIKNAYLPNPFGPQDARNANILQATEVLETILAPFAVTRMDHSTRQRNLEEITKRAATFAFVLFSQRSSWRLDWPDSRTMAPGSLVIFPALEQLMDEEGKRFQPPRAFSEMIVRQIDE